MDPMTMALIAKGVISGAKAIQGASQRSQARKLEEEVMSKGMPRLQTPAEYYELYKASQRDKAMEAETAQAQQIQASNIEALQTGGSRAMLGGAPAVVAATQANVAEAARRGYQREQQALSALAAANARTQSMNFQADISERNRQLRQAAIGFQAGTETLYNGLEGVASSAILGADEFGGVNRLTAEGTSNEIATPESPFGTEVTGVKTQAVEDFYNLSNPFSQYMNQSDQQNVDRATYRDSFDTSGRPQRDFYDPNIFPIVPNIDRATYVKLFPNIDRNTYGELFPEQKNGGPITTKGDFDHESNPLHVVDNDGRKVAEVTGQETLVYNPKQRQLMKKIMDRLISKGKVSLNEEEKREAKEVLKAFQK